METTELRIGNLIYDYTGCENIITGIHKSGSIRFEDDIVNNVTVSKPVILTEKQLLKCGFEQNDENPIIFDKYELRIYLYDNAFVPILLSGDVDLFKKLKGIQIPKDHKYVHELQNLYFTLKGVELQLSST